MKQHSVFRLLCIAVMCLYCTAAARAGQVISQEERAWARQILTQEKALGKRKNQHSIAVLYFDNKSGREELTALQKGMAFMLIRDLSETEQVEVVERTQLQALLDEMELGRSGLMDAETAPEIGVLLRTNYVAGGDILQGTTADLEVNASVFDVPLDKFTPLQAAAGAADELVSLEKKILFSILEHIGVKLSPRKKKELSRPLSDSTSALLSFFAGIDYSDRGLYLKAAQMYQQALAEDPKLTTAQEALEELQKTGLVTSEELGEKGEGVLKNTLPAETGNGLSTEKIVAIGLGMAVAGGGLALVALGGDDDDASSPASAPNPEDTSPPTVRADPAENTPLNCNGGNILFSFSEAMANSGEAFLSNGGTVKQGWRGDRVYELNWSSDESICNVNISTDITVTLSGFRDVSENLLAEPISFTYSAGEQEDQQADTSL